MKVGFAVSDITPELGIYLTGYGLPERLATDVHLPLKATAMVVGEGEAEFAVVGLDWCFVDWQLTQPIRAGIEAATGIRKEHILLCCSHTHSAPHTTYRRTLGRTDVDPENKGVAYALKMMPSIADAVKRAKEGARECIAGFNAGKSKIGVSRRGTDENGCVTGFIGDPNMMFDDNLTVARFKDAETKEDLGIFVHYGAHNTSMGSACYSISSDWCGVMRNRVNDAYPVPVLYVNGAEGDVGPRTSRRVDYSRKSPLRLLFGFSAGVGDGVKSAVEVGTRAAADVLQLLEDMRDYRKELPVSVRVGELKVPQALSMSIPEAKDVLANMSDMSEEERNRTTDYAVAQAIVAEEGKEPQPELVVEQTLVAFGPVALVPFPFEMFSLFSLRLRKYGPYEYTLLTSNTNGRNAYMPDRGAFAMGGYEPDCLKCIRPYVICPNAGDIAVSQSLNALRQLTRDKELYKNNL